MAERVTRNRESDPGDLDRDLDLATGIGVVINIGHGCDHLTTSNSVSGSHTRNFHIMDGGSNNHMGNDSHNDSMAISGTIDGPNLTPHMRNPSEVRARSVPVAPRPPPDQTTSDSPSLLDPPSTFRLRPPYQASTGRPRSESILSPPHLQEPEIPKSRRNSLSVLAKTEARPANFPPQNAGQWPHTAMFPGHTVLNLAHPPYIDKPPHQDVAIRHIHCEPEASLQMDWIDNQLVGRVIELSVEDTHLHRRTMVAMAISTGVRFLQCLDICRHPEMLRNSAGFYETHVAVVEKSGAEGLLIPGDAAVVIDRPEMYALRRHCLSIAGSDPSLRAALPAAVKFNTVNL
ncbi:hypothetical protein INS49_013740 [Diaporthe citri]|uniref:uncharacterized protein n=1 Tax=Diaporthe citri TaxID=83186 RepID=UPI001C7F344F|nr:uncharacterized protein INS49_013740 [Diaporthe citri]KAG6357859.1 hypothetical protein INS49_013740 [Diaporthe citri]